MENKPETKKHPAYIPITDENRDEVLEFYYKNRSMAELCEKPGANGAPPISISNVLKAKWILIGVDLTKLI